MAEDLRVRKNFGKIPPILAIPNLIEIQKRSFERFLQEKTPLDQREDNGLQGAFNSVFPIVDYNETASIEFIDYIIANPKYDVRECLEKGVNYAAPLKIRVKLNLWEKGDSGQKRLKESREQEVYLGELPLMTETGTFVINGVERVVVSQLHRSPGILFSHDKGKSQAGGKVIFSARIIPARGSWFDFEFDAKDTLYVRIDRRKKLHATIILKALGYTEEQILRTYYPIEEIKIKNGSATRSVSNVLIGLRAFKNILAPQSKEVLVKEGGRITKSALKKMETAGIREIPMATEELLERVTLTDIIDPETGEIMLESNEKLTEEIVEKILSLKTSALQLIFIDGIRYLSSLRDTLLLDKVSSTDEALIEIYKKLRPGEPPSMADARALFEGLFFDPKRYDLSVVGRLKLNKRLGLEVPLETRVLTDRDIIEILRYLFDLRAGKGEIDDIDHLGNRRIRAVGELLENQFRIGLVRMERAIKEKMTLTELETAMPHDIINAKPVIAVIKEFFGSSQLSQFMDQTNPLSEITHKRRLSALGPGGLTRERAGFEVRDVHPTHYGRICPVETPEGPNIGLITSLASYARVNDFGFIESPYRKVKDGKATEEVEYLSAIDGEHYVIAQATSPMDERGNLTGETVSTRAGGDFKLVSPEEIQYMDVSPKQIVSVSASLIPFLENDDANRALMGSNMQRQAVPLLHANAPRVGTGIEAVAARDSGVLILAKRPGVVESVDATRIVVRCDDGGVDVYTLVKFYRSNQATCVNQKPLVNVGDRVKRNRVLADGPATDMGELALGKNVLVAFMPWGGYNFEDAIIISERLVKEDVYSSIHIEEFMIEARETKLGPEEITRDIPNIGEESLSDLDESGIIRTGAHIKPGDILVGKVTPKSETQLTPEEKLLRAIFGEKAEEVRENCLYVPPGIEGTVLDVKVFTRKGAAKDKRTKAIEEDKIVRLQRNHEDEVRILKENSYRKMRDLLLNEKVAEDIRVTGIKGVLCEKGKKLTEKILDTIPDKSLRKIKLPDSQKKEQLKVTDDDVARKVKLLENQYYKKIEQFKKGDELPPGVLKIVKVYIAMKRKIQVGDKMAGRHGNKGVISIVVPEEDMPYMPDGTPVDIILNPLGVPSRMNVGQILETHLGWAAKELDIYVSTPVFEGARESEIKALLKEANLPESGQITLYDGKTGVPFQKPVTVGSMYIMKLHHLVDDKIHARSIGPYSLVTQQPLGGKAQFGGQRLGEMEVWALEAYGAAYTLQEFLTVKSDDVAGRARVYEAIVKGEANLEPGVPESFHVLIKELQSLGLDVDLLEEKPPEKEKRKLTASKTKS
ncbi:MAG TPA: DNA-directed RNA polymerase subunit beta [Nitrospirae bacterium]|nr:DNA-directed RNA polymerase subunit beta [Nitrospirota bacterium]HDZ02700.1 DNA-directed RNA polymerase subunit beta [Nitrospirota bacterium]